MMMENPNENKVTPMPFQSACLHRKTLVFVVCLWCFHRKRGQEAGKNMKVGEVNTSS